MRMVNSSYRNKKINGSPPWAESNVRPPSVALTLTFFYESQPTNISKLLLYTHTALSALSKNNNAADTKTAK